MTNQKIPVKQTEVTPESLMNPLLSVLRTLGGSGRRIDVYRKVVELGNYSVLALNTLQYPDTKCKHNIVEHCLYCARTHLRRTGYLKKETPRNIWALTSRAKQNQQIDPAEILRESELISKGKV